MDPLSITASVVALVTFAARTISAVTDLRLHIKSAPTELDYMYKELQSLSLILSRLQNFVSDTPSAVLKASRLEKPTELISVLAGCGTTLEQILLKISTTQALITGRPLDRVRQGFTWSSTKKDLCDLRVQLEHYKTAILLSLQLRSLEVVTVTSEVSMDTDARVKELLDQVPTLNTIRLSSNQRTGLTKSENQPVIVEGYHDSTGSGSRAENMICSANTREPETNIAIEIVQPTKSGVFGCTPYLGDPFGARIARTDAIEPYSDIGSWLSTFDSGR